MAAKQLEGKVAIITGGASGIGEAIAHTYSREGCRCLLVDIDGRRMEQVVDEVKAEGSDCIGVVADVVDEDAVIAFFKTAADRWGKIDLLVNSAGRDSLAPPYPRLPWRNGTRPLART